MTVSADHLAPVGVATARALSSAAAAVADSSESSAKIGRNSTKLDRLARNVRFIATLMDGNVEFVCCDMPQATRLTIHVLAAVAEHEREMIVKRTKEGLAAAKARGVKLGNLALAAANRTAALERAEAL